MIENVFSKGILKGPYKSALIAAPPLLLRAPQQRRAPQQTREFVYCGAAAVVIFTAAPQQRSAAIDKFSQKVKNIFYCAFFIFLLRPPQQPAEGAAEVAPKQAPKQYFFCRNRSVFKRPDFKTRMISVECQKTLPHHFYVCAKKFLQIVITKWRNLLQTSALQRQI